MFGGAGWCPCARCAGPWLGEVYVELPSILRAAQAWERVVFLSLVAPGVVVFISRRQVSFTFTRVLKLDSLEECLSR